MSKKSVAFRVAIRDLFSEGWILKEVIAMVKQEWRDAR